MKLVKFLASWTKYCKKSKHLYIYMLKNTIFSIFKFVWKIKIFSTRHLENSFWCCLSHWKEKEKEIK